MKAALIDRYGSNDLVKVADIAVPVMGPMDLLVQVHAASVNPVDAKTRDGKLKTLLKHRFPLVLGNDLSGVLPSCTVQCESLQSPFNACAVSSLSCSATQESHRKRTFVESPDATRSELAEGRRLPAI